MLTYQPEEAGGIHAFAPGVLDPEHFLNTILARMDELILDNDRLLHDMAALGEENRKLNDAVYTLAGWVSSLTQIFNESLASAGLNKENSNWPSSSTKYRKFGAILAKAKEFSAVIGECVGLMGQFVDLKGFSFTIACLNSLSGGESEKSNARNQAPCEQPAADAPPAGDGNNPEDPNPVKLQDSDDSFQSIDQEEGGDEGKDAEDQGQDQNKDPEHQTEEKKAKPRRKLKGPGTRNPGAQPGHLGHFMKFEADETRDVDCIPERCQHCSRWETECKDKAKCGDTRETLDIEFRRVNTKTTTYSVCCPECGKELTGEHPVGTTGSRQYGPNVRTLIILLYTTCMASQDAVHAFIRDFFNLDISVGTITGAIARAAELLKPHDNYIRLQCIADQLVVADETSTRVYSGPGFETENWWVHVAVAVFLGFVHYHAHYFRGSDGIAAGGILSEKTRIHVAHDFWGSYFKLLSNAIHDPCHAHACRETVRVESQDPNQTWAGYMRRFFEEEWDKVKVLKEAWFEGLRRGEISEDTPLRTDAEIQDLTARYYEIVKLGFEQTGEPYEVEGKRPKKKRSFAANLVIRFKDYADDYLRCFIDPFAPYSSNDAERALRRLVVWDKTTYFSRSTHGLRDKLSILSYTESAKMHGITPGKALRMLFEGATPEEVFGEEIPQRAYDLDPWKDNNHQPPATDPALEKSKSKAVKYEATQAVKKAAKQASKEAEKLAKKAAREQVTLPAAGQQDLPYSTCLTQERLIQALS